MGSQQTLGYCCITTATWTVNINGHCWILCLTVHLSSHLHGSFFIRNVSASKWSFPVCATRTNSYNLPSANLLLPKYLRNHKHKNKFLTTIKPQSESCCLLRTRNLQMQYADNLQTSVGRSMQLSALCTQFRKERGRNQSEGRQATPFESTMRCLSFSV